MNNNNTTHKYLLSFRVHILVANKLTNYQLGDSIISKLEALKLALTTAL